MVRRYAQRHPDKAVYIMITDTVCGDQAVPCDDARAGEPSRGEGTHYSGEGSVVAAEALLDEAGAAVEPSVSQPPPA
jgi:hypothetical protein